MSIKGILLAGAALCAISAAQAVAADAPHIHIAAMHKGAVAKSVMHTNGATNVTYTISTSTSVSTKAGYNVKTPLAVTFYTWESNDSICTTPKKQKVTLSTKKTKYASLSTSSETATASVCTTPTTYYGDVYELTTKKAAKKSDTFSSTLSAKFKSGGTTYKGKLNIDVDVSITK